MANEKKKDTAFKAFNDVWRPISAFMIAEKLVIYQRQLLPLVEAVYNAGAQRERYVVDGELEDAHREISVLRAENHRLRDELKRARPANLTVTALGKWLGDSALRAKQQQDNDLAAVYVAWSEQVNAAAVAYYRAQRVGTTITDAFTAADVEKAAAVLNAVPDPRNVIAAEVDLPCPAPEGPTMAEHDPDGAVAEGSEPVNLAKPAQAMPALKPCPFCGCGAYYVGAVSGLRIVCGNAQCGIQMNIKDPQDSSGLSLSQRWNKRPGEELAYEQGAQADH